MLSTLKLAVIVATKNRSELLATRSLPSIKNQTLAPDFLLVCDDSDSSNIEKNQIIVNQFQIKKCEVLYLNNRRTLGASGCWNSAIDVLLTKVDFPEQVFVAFLDDDDEWQPNYLETCLTTAYKYDLDMVACGINRIEDDFNISYQNLAPEALSVCSFLVGNPGIQGSNLFLRLDAFLKAGCFDESLVSSTDRDLCIRLAESKEVRYRSINQFLVHYYVESNRVRLSTSGSNAKLSGLTAFWQKYQGRMTDEQRVALSQRTKKLFNWQAPKSEANVNDNTAIVLAICSELNDKLLMRLVEVFRYFRKYNLVGLDVVFQVQNNTSVQQNFANTLRDIGIGCFSVSGKPLLKTYCTLIANLRPGSEVFYVDDLSDVHLKSFQDIKCYLCISPQLKRTLIN